MAQQQLLKNEKEEVIDLEKPKLSSYKGRQVGGQAMANSTKKHGKQ